MICTVAFSMAPSACTLFVSAILSSSARVSPAVLASNVAFRRLMLPEPVCVMLLADASPLVAVTLLAVLPMSCRLALRMADNT